MRRLALRIGVLVIVGGVGIAAASAAGTFFLAQGLEPQADGTLALEGLSAPVQVARDPFGVPHITAQNSEDGFVGLGFAHAQDRLWQMDLMRRHARGTLSELFGSSTVARDRLARTLGLVHRAEAELETLSARTLAELEAYSRGVNAWVGLVRAGRVAKPFEQRWLGHEIDDWGPADTVALVRLRAWNFSRSLSASLLLEELLDEVGSGASHDFFPLRPMEDEPRLVGSLFELGLVADAWAAGAGLHGAVGSLGFLVGVPRTTGDQPLLLNDAHLEFALPATPYLAHLKTPKRELVGVTWAGMPVFWSGRNQKIAWGQVALHASSSDLFDQTLHPSDPHRYDRNGRWLAADHREERIAVRYGDDEVFDVVSTFHGPLLGSALPGNPDVKNYALRWSGDEPKSGVEALMRLQRARTWPEFREYLRHYPSPPSTFMYADGEGNIGTQVAGRLPIRTILAGGLLPVPGSTRYYDWRGFIPYDDLPSTFGEDIPWLVVSSHRRDAAFPEAVTWLWRGGGGDQRLRERLRNPGKLGFADALELQRERRSAGAPELLARMLESSTGFTEHGSRVRKILLEWDGTTTTGSLGASVYHAFRQRLTQHLMRDRLRESSRFEPLLEAVGPAPGLLLASFLERASEKEGSRVVDVALDETWSWLGVHFSPNPRKWTWGAVHQVRLPHPFERLGGALLGWLGTGLGRGPFPAPGDADSVWAMHHGSLPAPAGVGPVVRLGIDLADPEHLQVGLAGGQSGHPGASHYDDGMADWLAGRPRPLWTHRDDLTYYSEGLWELHPPKPAPAYP